MVAAQKKIIVMTGATSGFGAFALRSLAMSGDYEIIVGARGQGREVPEGVSILPLDLASQESVRAFAGLLKVRLGERPIDILALNAGIHGSAADEHSAEGYGLTFAVNHLSHYLLVRLILPQIAAHGRLVITSSNMHDPPLKRLKPQSLSLAEWAHPSEGGAGTGIRSYIASKLCNLMTALTLARHKDVRARSIEVVAFNPGLTAGSSGRDASPLQHAVVWVMMRTIFPLIGLFRSEFAMNSAKHAGQLFADVITGVINPPDERIYISLVKGRPRFPDPSVLARDADAQALLWRESAKMVGL